MTEQTATDIKPVIHVATGIDLRALDKRIDKQFETFFDGDEEPISEGEWKWQVQKFVVSENATLLTENAELKAKLEEAEKVIRLAHVLSTNGKLTTETDKYLKEAKQ